MTSRYVTGERNGMDSLKHYLGKKLTMDNAVKGLLATAVIAAAAYGGKKTYDNLNQKEPTKKVVVQDNNLEDKVLQPIVINKPNQGRGSRSMNHISSEYDRNDLVDYVNEVRSEIHSAENALAVADYNLNSQNNHERVDIVKSFIDIGKSGMRLQSDRYKNKSRYDSGSRSDRYTRKSKDLRDTEKALGRMSRPIGNTIEGFGNIKNNELLRDSFGNYKEFIDYSKDRLDDANTYLTSGVIDNDTLNAVYSSVLSRADESFHPELKQCMDANGKINQAALSHLYNSLTKSNGFDEVVLGMYCQNLESVDKTFDKIDLKSKGRNRSSKSRRR